MGVVNPGCMGSHDLCPPLSQFQVREITLSELYAFSPASARGDAEKFKYYMAFLLIAPDKTVEGERVFGLVAVWEHPLQANTPLWVRKHMSSDYWLTQAMVGCMPLHDLMKACCHMPLSSEGQISVMVAGAPKQMPVDTSAN